MLKRRGPELQMEDLALAGQKVVWMPSRNMVCQMALNDRIGDQMCEFGKHAMFASTEWTFGPAHAGTRVLACNRRTTRA